MVSEGRWVKIALVAAAAIVVGSVLLVAAYRARGGDTEPEDQSVVGQCSTLITVC